MVLTRSVIDEYLEKKRELNKLNRQIDYYSKCVPKSEHGVVQSSMREYPFAATHIVLSGSDVQSDDELHKKLQQLVITLRQRQNEYDNVVIDIECNIALMEKEIGTIFFMKYVQEKSDKEIANELGYERSTITKKINSYFKEQEETFTHFT